MTNNAAVRLDGVTKSYRGPAGRAPVLKDLTVEFERDRLTAVMGPSGSGKTTLLHCAAGLDTPDSGAVFLGDRDLARCSQRRLTEIRRHRIGFVFQQFNLLPMLTAYDNVALALRLRGERVRRADVTRALAHVGLEGKARRRPAQLSGGEQQRVAIARTLVVRTEVVFADEPTGALDRSTGRQVMRLFRDAVDRASQTVVMVTHDPAVAAAADRVVYLSDGRVVGSIDRPSADEIAHQLTLWEQ